ncbi:hypothetical protein DJ031_00240, partial [bacterium endosymbiont of Escarpia laminata]
MKIDALTGANSWRLWKSAWIEYEVATDLDEKTQRKRASTLLSVIGQDAKDIWQNHPWTDPAHRYEVEPVLQMYENYCTPRVNIPYETHIFHSRKQRAGEDVTTWYNELRRIGTNCAFDEITMDEIYRDHLVSSVIDERVRNQLLEKRDVTLEKALDIIRNSEVKAERAKAWNSVGDVDVHSMKKNTRTRQFAKHGSEADHARPREKMYAKTSTVVNCSFCGKTHERGKCPAWRQKCRVCQGLNHFAVKCRKLKVRRDVKTIGTEQYGVSSLIDDSATRHSVNRVDGRQ